MYSWVSWKACNSCKYFNSVNVLVFVEVCIEKLKIGTREKQSLRICEVVLSEKQV